MVNIANTSLNHLNNVRPCNLTVVMCQPEAIIKTLDLINGNIVRHNRQQKK